MVERYGPSDFDDSSAQGMDGDSSFGQAVPSAIKTSFQDGRGEEQLQGKRKNPTSLQQPTKLFDSNRDAESEPDDHQQSELISDYFNDLLQQVILGYHKCKVHQMM